MTVGTVAKPAFNWGWHTYSWSTYYPGVDPIISGGGVWNSFSAGPDAQPGALSVTGKTNYNGTVTIKWGTRPGAYNSQSKPIPVVAGTAFTYRLTELQHGKPYYINGFASVSSTNQGNSMPLSAIAQYGEVTQTPT